ncbi:molybdate ABC transporter substrate-binding protein [Persephonella sp.]|uniref:molybdate ABC transporter substrate-binding protein n=1 Tax=Persephonella sp. TaxID=2060922 RepID=UPI0025FBFC3D|nr:molybdate ABC transporter substrate-binding protein [Persephonella sp.]
MRYILLTLLLFVFSYGQPLRIAASANIQYPLREIIKEFKKAYGIDVLVVISSSGKLTAQIERGAPYDIFLSANMKYPDYLYKKGLTIRKPVVYAEGVLVLWSMKEIPLNKIGINILKEKYIKKISVPNPKNAPYGFEAVRVLKNVGLYEQVKNKLVYGESVMQSTQYIYKSLVDAGFTSKSVVLSPKLKNKGVWIEVDKRLYNPIKQGVVVIRDNPYAEKFLKFLLSKDAQKILRRYGYRTYEQAER